MLEAHELMQGFVEDCREHLGHIESALMDLEAAGAAADHELVNSVFRAAHSIKGGAGMLGLDNIKTLSHKLENVLHLLRTGELTPDRETISVLLKGFDRLTDLVEHVHESETLSIDEQVQGLVRIAMAGGAEGAAPPEPERIPLDQGGIFTVDAVSLEQARAGGNYVYLLEYDLIHDIHGKNAMPFDVLKQLTDTGRIIDCKLDFQAVGGLDDFGNSIPFHVLFASILEHKYVCGLVKLPPERVRDIADAEDAVRVAPTGTFREEFGCVVLEARQGQGSLVMPGELTLRSLHNLKAGMLAALARCQELSLDLRPVVRCDLLFFQLLCSAHASFRAQGKRMTIAQALPQEHLAGARTLGFGCGSVGGCPFDA